MEITPKQLKQMKGKTGLTRIGLGVRGFVGPLGDDFPSIFPIVAGVLLFISTISFAGGLAADKNSYLEVRKAALSLSYIVTEKGFVTAETWVSKKAALEKAAQANNVFVLATVKRFCFDPDFPRAGGGEIVFPETQDSPESPYYIETSSEPKRTWLYATNNDALLSANPPVLISTTKRNLVMLNYPVAVPCPNADSPTFGLGMLNVIVWRR